MKITIIGAGPIGCYAGYLLAKADHQVEIYERKAKIGTPIQCTGLLTSDFEQFNFSSHSFLINTFTHLEVNSPQNKTTIQQKEYLVCRHKFDHYLAELAQKAGVKIFLNHSFIRKENSELIIKDNLNKTEKRIPPEIVIAADGPLSPTAQAYGFYHPQREHYYGIQAIVEGDFDPTSFQTYFGKETCPDLFAWIVPESTTLARVGLAAKKNSRKYFDQFLDQHHFTAKQIQAGTIPLYHPKQQLKKGNCYLLGDAAGFVKATTLGGLVPGLKQAEILADCLINKKSYRKEIKPLRRKLWLHLQLRKTFTKFSDQDWDKLVSLVNQKKIQQVLQAHTRDNPLPLLTKTLLKEPRLLLFTKYLF